MKVYNKSGKDYRVPEQVQLSLTKSGLEKLIFENDVLPLPEITVEAEGIESLLDALDSVKAPKIDFSLYIQRDVWLAVDVRTGNYTPVEPPSNCIGFIDTETVNIYNSIPMMAVLIADKGVFIYVSSMPEADPHSISSRIPLGQSNILAGYNVSFDRAQFSSSFNLDDDNQWLDIMSVVTIIHGYSNKQRGLVKKLSSEDSAFNPKWFDSVIDSFSLKSVANHYGIEMSKDTRDDIISMGIRAFQGNQLFKSLEYCYKDVEVTMMVGKIALAKLRQLNPIMVRGLIERNREILPLNRDWVEYFHRNEKKYHENLKNVENILMLQAVKIMNTPENERTEQQNLLDWAVLKSGVHKGFPKWYVALLKNPTINIAITPYILGIHYHGFPVFKVKGVWVADGRHIPHPETNKPISSLFVKGSKYECDDVLVTEALDDIESLTNWKATRKMVSKLTYIDMGDYLLHIPRLQAWGTISRRKNDTFMVLPNPKAKRIGTESRMMIESPSSSQVLVTFDVDSEEALIASLIGDMTMVQDRMNGLKYALPATCPFSNSTINGDKNKGTDIHSLIAGQVGISRGNAKTLNYGAIYGQGLEGTVNTLIQAGLSENEAKQKATIYNNRMKGRKSVDGSLRGGLGSAIFNGLQNLGKGKCFSLILENTIPASLWGDDEYVTTKRNWVIQSTGSDILDILVTGFYQLAKGLGIKARIIHTHHDSLTVLCNREDAKTVSVILATVHQRAWLMLIENLGLALVPTSILIPSEVEIGINYKCSTTPTYTIEHRDGDFKMNPSDILAETEIINRISQECNHSKIGIRYES
jgi:hypothetical protein